MLRAAWFYRAIKRTKGSNQVIVYDKASKETLNAPQAGADLSLTVHAFWQAFKIR